jgi:hypothetical protein
MSPDHEEHLQKIKTEISQLIDSKYRAGQKQHGGSLFHKAGLLDMAVEEIVDLVVYILTLKQQLIGEYKVIKGLKDIDE